MMNKETTGGIPNQSSGGGAEPTKALQIRRQSTDLDAVPRDARVDRDVGDCHSRRQTDEAGQRRRHRHPAFESHRQGRQRPDDPGEDEVGPAAVASEGEDVGEEAPEGLHDPGDGVEPRIELDGGGLDPLDVFPVIVGDDPEERPGEALVQAVDEDNAGHEGRRDLRREHLEPPERLEYHGQKRIMGVVGFGAGRKGLWVVGVGGVVAGGFAD